MSKRHAKQATPQRLATLAFIGAAGIASESQIHRRNYATILPASVRDQLNQMVRAGWIAVRSTDVRHPGRAERCYVLTTKGAQLFSRVARQELQVGAPSAGELRQQLLAQEARIQLEYAARERGAQVIEWRSERVLRSAYNRQWATAQRLGGPSPAQELPDAQAVLREADGRIHVIDIECDGQYYGQMLKSKVDRFHGSQRPIVWVCEGSRATLVQQAVTTSHAANIAVVTV